MTESPKAAIAILIVAIVCLTSAAQEQLLSNYQMTQNSNTETIKIGNSKTKNFNIQESNYQPTQYTQVVLNVPKAKVLRKSRPPTVEEFQIKQAIVDLYEQLKSHFDASQPPSSLDRLGRVIEALNPKYIATERVRRQLFPDPSDAGALPPLAQFQAAPVELSAASGSIEAQLSGLDQRFREQVSWDSSFVDALSGLQDAQLDPTQLAYKRLIVCLAEPSLCQQEVAKTADETEAKALVERENEQLDEQEETAQWAREQQEPNQFVAKQVNRYEDVDEPAFARRYQMEEFEPEAMPLRESLDRYQQAGEPRPQTTSNLRLNNFRKRYPQSRSAVQSFKQQPLVPRWQTHRPYQRY